MTTTDATPTDPSRTPPRAARAAADGDAKTISAALTTGR